jgi:putative spermidine/putrescine transport system ATP-binding protein
MSVIDQLAATRGVGVTFAGVERHYKDNTALAGLNLDIRPGEFVALLGPSGCGKTTALRILGGFDRPDAGTVTVGGRDVTTVPAHKRDMGMVFQSYSLFPNLNVQDNVAFGLKMRKTSKTDRSRRADELLALVGLEGRGQRFPFELSGGQQQRVAIARALAIEPTVLLLDEPLSALDARVRAQLREEIRSIQQRLGITTVFVTHDQAEALSMADRVGVMNAGRLEQLDTPEEVYRNPATAFVAEFVGAMNRVAGRIGDGGEVLLFANQRIATRPANGVPVRAGALVHAMLRPESLEAIPDSAGHGEIAERTFLGSALRLRVTLDDGNQVIVETSSTSDRLAVGSRVGLKVLAEQVAVTDPIEEPAPVASAA